MKKVYIAPQTETVNFATEESLLLATSAVGKHDNEQVEQWSQEQGWSSSDWTDVEA